MDPPVLQAIFDLSRWIARLYPTYVCEPVGSAIKRCALTFANLPLGFFEPARSQG